MDISDELAGLLAEEPTTSPAAVSAWMARKLADTIFSAFRSMDRHSAQLAAEGVAYDLEALANMVDMAGPEAEEDVTRTLSPAERQQFYVICDEIDRRVLLILLRKGRLTRFGEYEDDLVRLRDLHLVAYEEGEEPWTLTPIGRQVAEGLIRHNKGLWAKVQLETQETENAR